MQRFGCSSSMFNENAGALCSGLAQLKNEHCPLTEQMDAYYAFTLAIKNDQVQPNYDSLQKLYDQVQSFAAVLNPHSKREEGVLFEMVAAYIGRTGGPIAVMEYEHDQAKSLLEKFMEEAEQSNEAIEAADVKRITDYAADAYHILKQHFAKEETVLFPMANQLLSNDEKEILQEKINKM